MKATNSEASKGIDGLVRIEVEQSDLNRIEVIYGDIVGESGTSIQGIGRASRELRVAV
jgi:hypothetical protein